jgi:hypothetical protein
MRFTSKFRRTFQSALVAVLLSTGAVALAAQPGFARRGGFGGRAGAPPAGRAGLGGPRPNQEHLQQWMQRHSNLPLPEQQRALENEPGFRELPPQTQARLHNQLVQLNHMSPQQRQRITQRTELIEHLTPDQRQQFRSSVQQFSQFPEDRRRQIARAFRDLRELPQPQRDVELNSDGFRRQFSDQERRTLSNLLVVEPYLPAQRPGDAPPFGR